MWLLFEKHLFKREIILFEKTLYNGVILLILGRQKIIMSLSTTILSCPTILVIASTTSCDTMTLGMEFAQKISIRLTRKQCF